MTNRRAFAQDRYAADSDSNARRNPGWRRGIYIGSARDSWVTAFIPDPEPNPDALVTSGAEVGPRTVKKYAKVGGR